jgi:hypothetical protein
VTANENSIANSNGNSHSVSVSADHFNLKNNYVPMNSDVTASAMREDSIPSGGSKLPTMLTNNTGDN